MSETFQIGQEVVVNKKFQLLTEGQRGRILSSGEGILCWVEFPDSTQYIPVSYLESVPERERITTPNKPGWWWAKCENGEKEPIEVIMRLGKPSVKLFPSNQRPRCVLASDAKFNWLGPVNPEPLPMPYKDDQ